MYLILPVLKLLGGERMSMLVLDESLNTRMLLVIALADCFWQCKLGAGCLDMMKALKY